MEIISKIAEFDQDKQEKFVKVKLYDNELDIFREAMTEREQTYSKIMNPNQKSEVDKMKQISKGKKEIDLCWDMTNS